MAAPNGGYLRIAADQRWLQTVIRFRAWRRAKRRIGAGRSLTVGAAETAQIIRFGTDGRSRFHCAALSLGARRPASPAAYRAGWLAGGTTNTGARGPRAVRFPRRMDPASAGRWPANHPAPHHDHWRRATSGPARDSAKPIAALSWISFRWQGTGTFSRRRGRCCRRAPHRARPCSPAGRGCPRAHG